MKGLQRDYLHLSVVQKTREYINQSDSREYSSHLKRLDAIDRKRKTSIQSKDNELYDNIKNQQLILNRKKELNKWQQIQHQNSQMLKRLVKITRRLPSPLQRTPSQGSQASTPRSSSNRRITERDKMILKENLRLKQKITSAGSDFQNLHLMNSYEKHLKLKTKIQKFQRDGSSQKRRADNLLDVLDRKKQKSLQIGGISPGKRMLSNFSSNRESSSMKGANSVMEFDILKPKNYAERRAQMNFFMPKLKWNDSYLGCGVISNRNRQVKSFAEKQELSHLGRQLNTSRLSQ